ncbi:hypothetical protein [Nocardia pseudovaccinii]|uniref:hypothetical protein n=1 Tax=Nocardia pseudovaccinii TaxID=189540 RepID=UPI0007A41622|nr:hypothetical protein [Nocardia pseudovaccinii]
MVEFDYGLWVKLSMCGIGVKCGDGTLDKGVRPSRCCMELLLLIDGQIGEDRAIVLGHCPVIAVRVADDTANFEPDHPAP